VEEHGRTFHKYKEGKYVLPNDGEEQNRLDLQHHLFLKLVEGRLHLAPLKTPRNVLDIGTGTGLWAIEFANQYPYANVIGSDLSPIQPQFVPPNCQFEVDDAEDEWVYTKQFDFIHWRALLTCFSDPRSVIAQAYKQCTPGGYLELQDADFPFHCSDDTFAGTALESWTKGCVEAGIKMGRPWTNTPNLKRWMEEAGFEDVKEKIFHIPTNTWPKGRRAKELGIWFNADMNVAINTSKALFMKILGWTPERVEAFFVDVMNDLKNKGIHAYMPL
jgi:ubiquinone/menaquinone biosynthesis C-methylase UbiE